MSVAAGVFLLLHGVLTGAMWIPRQRPSDELVGFGPQATWLFARNRKAVVSAAVVASTGFIFAGLGVMAGAAWWPPVASIAAVVSLALITATFTPWWLAAIVINLAIIYAAWTSAVDQLTPG